MDKNYYFVLEADSSDDGPYVLAEIRRRLGLGWISYEARLCRVGDTEYVPIVDERFRPYLEAVRRPAQGTPPPVILEVASTALALPAAQPQFQQPPPPAETPQRARATRMTRKKLLIAAGGGGAAVLAITGLAVALQGSHAISTKDAMVRVTTPSATGAGFLIEGPDNFTYVATANHVVDRGERVLIERDVGNDKSAFVEAYPETEIVATDPDADLAIIRIKNVDAARFTRLPLAPEPVKDEKILSYGYPGSSLAKHAGLMSKDGKVLSLVSFPAYDERYARILRDNAVEGLLISTDIEPGFSGGPTVDESGRVVGVNVTKDRAHVGQNGAVSVAALRELVKRVQPAAKPYVPVPADVVALLDKVQSQYLLLPLDERAKVRETDFLDSTDLPGLRHLVGEVRRQERNTDIGFVSKYHLSGQAAIGIYFARLPGKMLETYRAPSTTGPMLACELANQHLTSFLGDLSADEKRVPNDARALADLDSCDELGVRPLGWDLVAASLAWDGKEKQYTVAKLDRMDDEGRVYRASVRISGVANLVEVWVGVDQQQVRLKVFDPTGNLYAIRSSRGATAGELQGTWAMKRPRVTAPADKEAEVESDETLSISSDDAGKGKISLRYVIRERYFGAGDSKRQFRCDRKTTIETGLLQSFSGTIDNGVIVAFPDKDAEQVGADAGSCDAQHKADHIVAAKLAGDTLYLYRTDGNAYPETIQLTRQ